MALKRDHVASRGGNGHVVPTVLLVSAPSLPSYPFESKGISSRSSFPSLPLRRPRSFPQNLTFFRVLHIQQKPKYVRAMSCYFCVPAGLWVQVVLMCMHTVFRFKKYAIMTNFQHLDVAHRMIRRRPEAKPAPAFGDGLPDGGGLENNGNGNGNGNNPGQAPSPTPTQSSTSSPSPPPTTSSTPGMW